MSTVRLAAVLVGGYAGTWCGASVLDTPFAPGPLASIGATMGVGAIIGLSTSACGIAETARIARFLAGESAGQCGPCVFGLPAIAGDLERLASGRAGPEVLDRIAGRRRHRGRARCMPSPRRAGAPGPERPPRLRRRRLVPCPGASVPGPRRPERLAVPGRFVPAPERIVSERRRLGLRLRVDPVACDAFGYCAELLPERVALDEWGYPLVDGTPLEPGLVALATRAAAACPRRAVRLEKVVVG